MKISVITVTLDSEATLARCLDSVAAQSHPDVEHIIVDGASTDSTLEIIRSYASAHLNVKFVSEPDKGLYDAMNKGIAMATGDVVGFLNSDDRYADTDILALIASNFDVTPSVEMVYGDVVYSSGERVVRRYSSRKFRRRKMLMGLMPAHPAIYARRAVYERFGGFDTDYALAADFENLLRIIYCGRTSSTYVNREFVVMQPGGKSWPGAGSAVTIMRDHYRAYRRHGLWAGMLLDPLRYPARLLQFLR